MPIAKRRQSLAAATDGNGAVLSHQLRALAKFSTPTVANVLALIDGNLRAAGFASGCVRAVHRTARPAVGFAVTATCRSAASPGESVTRLTTDDVIERHLDAPHPPILVLQDLEPQPRSAVFGEMIATAFARFGYAGLITNGACRDVAELRRLRFPCWSSSCVAGFAGGGYIDCGAPVTVDGLRICPGDLVHADINGIIKVPLPLLPLLIEGCRRFSTIERTALVQMKESSADIEKLREIFQELREGIQKLRQDSHGKVEVTIAPTRRRSRVGSDVG